MLRLLDSSLIAISGSQDSCKSFHSTIYACNVLPCFKRLIVARYRLIVIPLSFLRRLDSLKYTSVVALISIGYLVILVVFHFFKGDTMHKRGPVRVINWGGAVPTLSSFPVIVFAYTCHQNVSGTVNPLTCTSPKCNPLTPFDS